MKTIKLQLGIKVEKFYNFKELYHLRKAWDDFVESVGGDIFLTYDWCKTWWEFYGEGRILRILVYKKNESIIGLMPLFYEFQWIGPLWLKIAKFIGADFTITMVNPPTSKDYSTFIFKNVIESVFAGERCDAFLFGPTSGRYDGYHKIREAIHESESTKLIKDSIQSPYTIFRLPGNFDAYIQSLKKRQRGNLRRDLNLIGRSFDICQDVINDDEYGRIEFKKFVLMHNEQWESEGKLGHFNDWPKGVQFNAKLLSRMAVKGRLRLLRLIADGNVVSYQLCYAFGKRWYWRLPARVVGSDWNKFGLGRIGLIKEIEMAIDEGVEEIEAGPGHYDYKIKLGGEEHPLNVVFMARNQLFCRLRVFLYLKLSEALHFIYYRIWFNRLAPLLPFKRKPLWKLWIRTRN